jgi:hypothetical protein
MECRLRPSPNARKQQDEQPKKIVKVVKTSFAFCWMDIFVQRNQIFVQKAIKSWQEEEFTLFAP